MPTLLPAAATLKTLNLSTNELSGTIPESFGGLSTLQTLNLYGNALTGPPLPATLRLLAPLAPTLEVLRLDHNELGGAITDDIAAFTNLTALLLEEMGLEGTVSPSIGQLTRLKSLDLGG